MFRTSDPRASPKISNVPADASRASSFHPTSRRRTRVTSSTGPANAPARERSVTTAAAVEAAHASSNPRTTVPPAAAPHPALRCTQAGRTRRPRSLARAEASSGASPCAARSTNQNTPGSAVQARAASNRSRATIAARSAGIAEHPGAGRAWRRAIRSSGDSGTRADRDRGTARPPAAHGKTTRAACRQASAEGQHEGARGSAGRRARADSSRTIAGVPAACRRPSSSIHSRTTATQPAGTRRTQAGAAATRRKAGTRSPAHPSDASQGDPANSALPIRNGTPASRARRERASSAPGHSQPCAAAQCARSSSPSALLPEPATATGASSPADRTEFRPIAPRRITRLRLARTAPAPDRAARPGPPKTCPPRKLLFRSGRHIIPASSCQTHV